MTPKQLCDAYIQRKYKIRVIQSVEERRSRLSNDVNIANASYPLVS